MCRRHATQKNSTKFHFKFHYLRKYKLKMKMSITKTTIGKLFLHKSMKIHGKNAIINIYRRRKTSVRTAIWTFECAWWSYVVVQFEFCFNVYFCFERDDAMQDSWLTLFRYGGMELGLPHAIFRSVEIIMALKLSSGRTMHTLKHSFPHTAPFYSKHKKKRIE